MIYNFINPKYIKNELKVRNFYFKFKKEEGCSTIEEI